MEEICEICGAAAPLWDVVDFNRCCEGENTPTFQPCGKPIYYCRCVACGFCFAPEIRDWSDAEFIEKIYNAEYYTKVDKDYELNRPLQQIKALLEWDWLGVFKRHLDYGGGSGNLTNFVNQVGLMESHCYDVYSKNHTQRPAGLFDFITAFEVFEHVPHPTQLVQDILSFATEKKRILFSTYIHAAPLSDRRITNGYIAPRNGHISIFSEKSLHILSERFNLTYENLSPYMHMFSSR